VPEAVVVLEVVVGVMFADPGFENKSLVVFGVAGGEAVKPFRNLMVNQPIQLNPGIVGKRTFLKMKVGMKCDLVAWILGFLRVDTNWRLLVKQDNSWSFRRIWDLGWFCFQEGTEELISKVPCFFYCCGVVSDKGLPLDTAKPVGLEDLLELIFNDCLMDYCRILMVPGIQ